MQMRLNSFSTTDGLIDNDGTQKIECLLLCGHGNQEQNNINNKRYCIIRLSVLKITHFD